MKQNITDQFTFDAQSLRSITDYLRATGWQRIRYQNRRLAVYTKELQLGASPVLVALPERTSYSDFSTRMAEAVQQLADVEETSPGEMYQRIQSAGQDSIFLRFQLPADRSVPSVEVTASFLDGVCELIVYAACMQQDADTGREAKRYFTQPYRIGREQAERCLFDHTFYGSFGFTIRSPLPSFEEIPLSHVRDRIGRGVVERITRGLMSVQSAREEDTSQTIIEQYQTGLNGNMCKAVLKMLEKLPDITLEYSVRWSLSLPPAQDVAHFRPILLNREAIYYLQDAARYLETSALEVEENKTIVGKVMSLSAENPAEREVTMLADGYGKVSFLLDGENYVRACDAHRDSTSVRVTGALRRKSKGGKLWTLLSPRDFAVEG